jgi:hypothetical protein
MNKAREYSSPLMEELVNETTPEELEKINKEMEAMIPKFKAGDKLKVLENEFEHRKTLIIKEYCDANNPYKIGDKFKEIIEQLKK